MIIFNIDYFFIFIKFLEFLFILLFYKNISKINKISIFFIFSIFIFLIFDKNYIYIIEGIFIFIFNLFLYYLNKNKLNIKYNFFLNNKKDLNLWINELIKIHLYASQNDIILISFLNKNLKKKNYINIFMEIEYEKLKFLLDGFKNNNIHNIKLDLDLFGNLRGIDIYNNENEIEKFKKYNYDENLFIKCDNYNKFFTIEFKNESFLLLSPAQTINFINKIIINKKI